MNSLIFLDIETGGFSKKKNAICEIALIVTDKNLNILVDQEWIIAPYKRCPSVQETPGQLCSYKPDAMAVNGITDEQIQEGTPAEEVAQALKQIFDTYGRVIVGHNAKSFDAPWIEEFLLRFGHVVHLEVIDTMLMAKEKTLPVPNHKLPTLLDYFGIKNEAEHRAMGDTRATMELYKKLLI